MPLICIPGDEAVPFLTKLLHGLLEEKFGQATRAELEAEIERQYEEHGVGETDARVIWLRQKIAALDTPG